MRQQQIDRAIEATKLQKVDTRAVKELGHLFVARLRCSSLRCSRIAHGFRKPDEWIDWRAQECGKCGRRLILIGGVELFCEVEANAAVKVVRFREVDERTLDPKPGSAWQYAPFEFGDVSKLPDNVG